MSAVDFGVSPTGDDIPDKERKAENLCGRDQFFEKYFDPIERIAPENQRKQQIKNTGYDQNQSVPALVRTHSVEIVKEISACGEQHVEKNQKPDPVTQNFLINELRFAWFCLFYGSIFGVRYGFLCRHYSLLISVQHQ